MPRRSPWRIVFSLMTLAVLTNSPALAKPVYPTAPSFPRQLCAMQRRPPSSVCVVLPRAINPTGNEYWLRPGTMVFAFQESTLNYHETVNGRQVAESQALYNERVVRTPDAVLLIDPQGNVGTYPANSVLTRIPSAIVLRFVQPDEAMPPDVEGLAPAYIVPLLR